MKYTVSTIRSAGLEARWTRTRDGAPIIAAREPGKPWYIIGRNMWEAMKTGGVNEVFKQYTLLGDIFSVPA